MARFFLHLLEREKKNTEIVVKQNPSSDEVLQSYKQNGKMYRVFSPFFLVRWRLLLNKKKKNLEEENNDSAEVSSATNNNRKDCYHFFFSVTHTQTNKKR